MANKPKKYNFEVQCVVTEILEDGTAKPFWEDKGQVWYDLDYLGVLALQGALMDGLEETIELGKANAAAKGRATAEQMQNLGKQRQR